MQPAADIIWCGASAPVVQGIFVGLGVSVIGLVVFPFAFVPVRPSGSKQSNYGRITAYVKWARRVSWALTAFAGVTLTGYVILYTDANGKFCSVHFDQHMQLGVYIWTGFTGVTFAMLVVTAILRGLSRRLSNSPNSNLPIRIEGRVFRYAERLVAVASARRPCAGRLSRRSSRPPSRRPPGCTGATPSPSGSRPGTELVRGRGWRAGNDGWSPRSGVAGIAQPAVGSLCSAAVRMS
jgi:hypothetical protein